MKNLFYLLVGLAVSSAMVSCVDDEESDQVKELRQAEIDKLAAEAAQEQASTEQLYLNMYNTAVSKVKSLLNDISNYQQCLDDVVSGKVSLEAAKEAIVSYNEDRIAQAEKDIEDEKAVIAIYEKAEYMTSEEIEQATISARLAYESAQSASYDYWTTLTDQGYNYDGYDVTYGYYTKINELIGYYTYNSTYFYSLTKTTSNLYKLYIPQNHTIRNYEFVTLLKNIFNNNGSYYSFYDDNRTDATYNTIYLSSVVKNVPTALKDADDYTYYTTYLYYDIDADEYNEIVSALKANIAKYKEDNNTIYYEEYSQKLDSIESNYTKLTAAYSTYKKQLDKLVGYSVDIYDLQIAYNNAQTLYYAYQSYSASDIEQLILNRQANIYNLEQNIATYKNLIENASNNITDNTTLNSYYTKLIAQLESEIEVQKSIAELYRKRLLGTSTTTTTSTSAE